MTINYKTKCTQETKSGMRPGCAAALYVLTCVLHALRVFVFAVARLHSVSHAHHREESAVRKPDSNKTRAANARRRHVYKSRPDMAAEAAKEAIQASEKAAAENGAMAQRAAKKARKAADNALKAGREATEAADAARQSGKAAVVKKAARKDKDAEKAAKKARKAAKRAARQAANSDGNNSDGNNSNDNDRTSIGSSINDIMQKLTSGPCQKMAKNLLSGLKFKFSKKHNASYGLDDLYRVLLAACVGDGKASSIDGQCRQNRKIKDNGRVPSRSWVFGMVNGVRYDYLLPRCRTMIRKSVLHARRRGMLNGAVDISIDMHDIPFYAKCMKLLYAVKSRGKSGTTTFNRLATVHCVTAGQRLTLGVEVVRREDETADVVARLLDWCLKHGIVISSLTMDRGFHSAAVINAVKRRGVPFVMPAVKNDRIKEIIRRYDAGEGENILEHTITSSSKESASYILIILKRKDMDAPLAEAEAKALDELYKKIGDDDDDDTTTKKYIVFATTMEGEWMHGDPHTIAEFYRRRWGIENSYKSFEMIRPRTTSTNYQIRILWWFLPFVLYNVWILGCFMAARRTDIPNGRTAITLGDFLTYMQKSAFKTTRQEQTDRPPD